MRAQLLGLVMTVALLPGCASNDTSQLPRDASAYALFPPPQADAAVRNYLISPLDILAVTVFQEPDLSVRDMQVDSGGNVILPLIGKLRASGKTSEQLSNEVAHALNVKYLTNAQVTVIVQAATSQKVTVEGSVTEPGVYEIRGRTTLLDALAMAKGTSRVAALTQVVVFREINGQRMGALFDVKQISSGRARDPEILGNDTVVVGLSSVKAVWRDILIASPLVSAFRPLM
jgi:polysaccharide export outer membrane protein